tara:strand:- start:14825 stop:15274 length:450 start_codon:yes stop_codon:yes gene_type:complete
MKSKTHIIKSPKKALKDLEKLTKSLIGDDLVKVGLPKNSNDYPDGTSVIMVGAVHEFGSPSRGIPERSYLRSTINGNRAKYKSMLKKLAKKIIDGKLKKKQALGLLGLAVQGDIIQKISKGIPPPTKQGTPLIDTGHLRQSITYQVGDE